MSYTPDIIANAFIHKARGTGVPRSAGLTHMKLQKLVFFVHAWGLALHGASPVGERPQAWEYGPVFDSLYHMLKGYGSRAVSDYLFRMNPDTGQRQALIPAGDKHQLWNLIGQVCQRYGPLDALSLSALTHEKNSPWEMARQRHDVWLDDEEVANFYRGKLPHAHG